MSNGWSGGSTRAWRTLRAAVLARDRGMCQLKIPNVCVQQSTPMHVHHTQGRRATGDDHRYLVASCAPCNQHIGDPARNKDPRAVPITRW